MKPKTITSHGVPKQLPGRGPNGRRFCRWCHDEVPPRRDAAYFQREAIMTPGPTQVWAIVEEGMGP